MKTIGMIGGMSWESTAVYYRVINRETQARLGGVHSAPLLLWSFDFAEIDVLQSAGKWDAATARMVEIGQLLVRGGAEFLIICCNTMHVMAEQVEKGAGVPLLHIATPLGAAIAAKGLKRVGVLGTKYTMKADFLRTPLARDYDIAIMAPEDEDARETHRIIYEELARGLFLDSSRKYFRGAIARLKQRGAEGVILGCTELPLIVRPDDADIPLFDTAELHAQAAVDMALP
jgi:aspartate racemase